MLYGVFHGDLHGGNLFVRPDGQDGAGRLRHHRPHQSEAERLAFLLLLVGGTR